MHTDIPQTHLVHKQKLHTNTDATLTQILIKYKKILTQRSVVTTHTHVTTTHTHTHINIDTTPTNIYYTE